MLPRSRYVIYAEVKCTMQCKYHFQLPISNMYPTDICSECSDHLENFHFYKYVVLIS